MKLLFTDPTSRHCGTLTILDLLLSIAQVNNSLHLVHLFSFSHSLSFLGLADLIVLTRPFLKQVSKAKAGRLVRALVDLFLDLEAGTGREIELCRECINWANEERRVFLRQALETRLMGLYYENGHYEEALKLGKLLFTYTAVTGQSFMHSSSFQSNLSCQHPRTMSPNITPVHIEVIAYLFFHARSSDTVFLLLSLPSVQYYTAS
ncbi:unnamed protein product [Echinostoma caproni]|uniref:RPN6_N domain-containing protein n=1 Tax=Echinostoma caproni TaxID=27848 RepID=A0A183ATN9_9TREM|nr:unnamed protein product [Echinostoma caproni]